MRTDKKENATCKSLKRKICARAIFELVGGICYSARADVTLGGDLGGFDAFSCTVELGQGATISYSITVSKTTLTGTMSSVAVGVYDIWVEHSYTAGSSATTGTVTLTYP